MAKNERIDWSRYHLDFPQRYFEGSLYDVRLSFFLEDHPEIKTVLEIGGGKGNLELRERGIDTWLLDPYFPAAGWMKGKVTWNTDMKFNLIVARNSINYLTKKEIKQIPSLGNIFFANSFAACPPIKWTERPFVSESLEQGIERARFNIDTLKIDHELLFESGRIIRHSFFYYSIKEYKEILPSVKIEQYNKNSILLFLGASFELK